MIRTLTLAGALALTVGTATAATVAEFEQQIGACSPSDAPCVGKILVRAVAQFSGGGGNGGGGTSSGPSTGSGGKTGVYLNTGGDNPCKRYTLERKAQGGALHSVRLQCDDGTGGNGWYKCNAAQVLCTLNSDTVEIFDENIEVSVGGKSSTFKLGKIVNAAAKIVAVKAFAANNCTGSPNMTKEGSTPGTIAAACNAPGIDFYCLSTQVFYEGGQARPCTANGSMEESACCAQAATAAPETMAVWGVAP